MDRLEEIKTRKNEIRNEVESIENIDEITELSNEVDALNQEERSIKEHQEKRKLAEELEKDCSMAKDVTNERKETKMDTKELRNSAKYINAYAEYIKTGEDKELRTLLTTNVENGTIAVPDFVYDTVKTAWDNNEIMSLVAKSELKGNLKVQFEISGSDAVIHTEGSGTVTEETLTEGIVTIVPANIKKWISISDEVMELRGEAFLKYIYSELTYRITKKAADQLIALIAALPATATATSVSANKINTAPEVSTIAKAIANLSDEAANPVIIMNKLSYANFKEVQYANKYGMDVFEGLTVKFNNSLPAYDAAAKDAVYAIVGDLGHGALANFPNGAETVEFKFDELSRKKEDLVEILGKQYVGLGLVADKSFALITKPGTTTQTTSTK